MGSCGKSLGDDAIGSHNLIRYHLLLTHEASSILKTLRRKKRRGERCHLDTGYVVVTLAVEDDEFYPFTTKPQADSLQRNSDEESAQTSR